MNRSSVALKRLRNELGVSKHIPITHLNSPTVFEASNSMMGMVIKLEGVTFDTEQEAVLNQNQMTWHRALSALDERFCIMVTTHRHKQNIHLEGGFFNTYAKLLNDRYHAQFKNQSMYVNDLYLTVIYKGITSGKVGKGLSFIQRLTDKAIKHARVIARQEQIKALQEAVHQLSTQLSVFKPRILGEDDPSCGYSELLSFLSLMVNGGLSQRFKNNGIYFPIAKNISDIQKNNEFYPFGNLAHYLPRHQLFFGKTIQFQSPIDTHFGAMITIKQYGTESASVMLDPLLHLDCDFISTNSYAIESKEVVLNRIQKHIIKMDNVNDPAISQIAALEEARDQLASGLITMGYHHNTILLLANTKNDVEEAIAKGTKCYADIGFVAVQETLGLEPAFWAQIPTNIKYIARGSLITSKNFVDFAPLHNYRTGYRDGNHLGSAVTLLETPSKTPYFFNFHVNGNPHNPSKGHTIIIGGNGSGKTALMGFMDAQLSRYKGDSFYFDRDRSSEIYIRASAGSYALLSPDYPESTCFNPLQLPDTPSNRQFNRELLSQFCKNEDEAELDAEINEQLKNCIDYAYDHLQQEHRTFSHVIRLLPIHFSRWPQLRRWLKGDSKNPDGQYAYIFDNETDQLNLQHKMGFDLTHFLDREPTSIRTAVMMYLCHWIESNLNGQLTAIYFDEGWQNLIDPYWKNKFQRWLPTLRKKNAFIVISTQSPSSVIHSPLRGVILDNVATQIYFANPQAHREEYIDGFKLTDSEFETIVESPPQSRLFLVKQEHDSTMCRLNLSHLPDDLAILSGNTQSVQLLDAIRSEVGDDPAIWMPIFHQRHQEIRA